MKLVKRRFEKNGLVADIVWCAEPNDDWLLTIGKVDRVYTDKETLPNEYGQDIWLKDVQEAAIRYDVKQIRKESYEGLSRREKMKLVCAECRSNGYSYDVFVRCKDKWLAVDITKGFHAPVRQGKTYGEAKARLMKWLEFAKDFGTGRFCKYPDEFRLSYSGLCRRLDYDKDEVD